MSWWRRWLGQIITASDPDFWKQFYGQDTYAGEPVNEHVAMNSSAFWACTRRISQTVATLPIGVFERGPNGEKRAVSDHPLYALLHDSPNADQTATEFWEARVLGLCTLGNTFAEKKTAANGRLISLERMPADTRFKRLDSGAIEYRFYDRGKEEKLPEEKVFHIRAFGDGVGGMSPVEYARQTLSLSAATDRAAAQVFSKGMRSKGFFVMPTGQTLTADQRRDAQKALVEQFQGPNGKDWGILEGGVDVKTVSVSSRDAELIASRRFNVEDICRWLDVPPVLIGHAAEGQTMWGSGIEQIMIGWLTLGLRPYLTRIEQRIRKDLRSPADKAKGVFAEFAVEGLLRGDSAARAEFLSKMVNSAALKPNEWRAKENLPPVDGGDQLFINSTMVPLNQAGAPKAQPAPPVEEVE